MDATEVTVQAYRTCVDKGICSAVSVDCAGSTYASGEGSLPINCVDWRQAFTYCRSKGKRLPTEEEREWAARGGVEARPYPWGHEAPGTQSCWSGLQKRTRPCSVGMLPAGDNLQHIHDLAGNVWEWTGTADAKHPDWHIIRGGAWNTDKPALLRAGYRIALASHSRAPGTGFRCAGSF